MEANPLLFRDLTYIFLAAVVGGPIAWKLKLPLLGELLLLIVFGKFLIWLGVMRLFCYSLWTSIAVAAGLTQIGELSFVLAEVARKSGLVGEEVFTATLAASLISIFLNVFIVRGVFRWAGPRLSAEKVAA